jgi:hypothetical protein
MKWYSGKIFHLCDHGRSEAEVLAKRPNPCPVQALTGCGTLVPAACYREVGLYDADQYPQYHADAEFVLRATRAGFHAYVDLRAVVWNDALNTCAGTVGNPTEFVFSRRSAVYWKPVLAIHRTYCPRHLLPVSLAGYYARFLWYNDPRARRAKQIARHLLTAARRLAAR